MTPSRKTAPPLPARQPESTSVANFPVVRPDADDHDDLNASPLIDQASFSERASDHPGIGDFVDRLGGAAIEAELDTGEREETTEAARAHVVVRVARMTLGVIVVILGIAAIPLPGPGGLIIAGGLAILAKDVAWAERLLRYMRRKTPGIPEDGKIPRSSIVTMLCIMTAGVAASLWFTLR